MRAKRYNDRADILKAIRMARIKRQKLVVKAESIELEMDAARTNGTAGVLIATLRQAAKKLLRAGRIESVRIKKLWATLAAFDTKTFDFMGGDNSVTMQN
jgi:hypothetical protein